MRVRNLSPKIRIGDNSAYSVLMTCANAVSMICDTADRLHARLPKPVPPLILQTAAERDRWRQGANRRKIRLAHRGALLSLTLSLGTVAESSYACDTDKRREWMLLDMQHGG